MIHELKIKPEYFAAVVSGDKTFEIRNNADRNFKVGDTLLLWEWDDGFTGQTAERTVSYITDFEQKPVYVVLGLANKREQELAEQLADATRQCGVMAGLLREAIGEVPQTQSFPSRCDAALAGKLPDRQDAEWTDATTSPVAADYRELQEQRDQLQSKHKAAMDVVRELVDLPYSTGGVLERLEVRERARDLLAGHVPATEVPEGWQLVPFNPTTDQWNGLARAIIFWMRSYPSNQHTPSTLVEFITSYGYTVPKWMEEESEFMAKNHVISKGTAATLIYKAMLADCKASQGGEPCATEPPSSSPA